MSVSLGGEPIELRERTAELSALARERSGRIALAASRAAPLPQDM